MSAQTTLPASAYSNADALAEAVADRLSGPSGKAPRRSGSGWAVCCPAHEDRNPSVSVKAGDRGDRALVKCAKCDTPDVLATVGLTMADLFLDRAETGTRRRETSAPRKAPDTVKPAETKRIRDEHRGNLERAIREASERWTDYADSPRIVQACEHQAWTVEGITGLRALGYIAGPTGNDRLRMIYRNADGDAVGYVDRATLPRHGKPKCIAATNMPRDLWPAPESLPNGTETVLIGEGEKVALALASAEVAAIGIPGTGAWREGDAHRFRRFGRVILLPDADDDGRTLMRKVARHLAAVGVMTETWEAYPRETDTGRDVADLLAQKEARGLDAVLGLLTRSETEPEPEAEEVATEPEPEPFPLLTVQDLGAMPAPKPLVQGIVDQGDLFGIVAPASTGKSALAVDLALSVASGTPWMGRRVRQGAVIYVALEGGRGYGHRLDAWEGRTGLRVADLPFRLIMHPLKLNSGDDWARLIASIRQAADELGQDISMVLVDTVRRAFAGGENENTPWAMFVDSCDRIREATGATIGLVHHTGKDHSRGARGHSVFETDLAPIIVLHRPEVKPATEETITVTCVAARGGKAPKEREAFQDFHFHLESVDLGLADEWGDPITGVIAVAGRNPRDGSQDAYMDQVATVRDWIAQNPGCNRTAVKRDCLKPAGMGDQAAFDLLKRMEADGYIRQESEKRGAAVILGPALFSSDDS